MRNRELHFKGKAVKPTVLQKELQAVPTFVGLRGRGEDLDVILTFRVVDGDETQVQQIVDAHDPTTLTGEEATALAVQNEIERLDALVAEAKNENESILARLERIEYWIRTTLDK